MEKKKRECISLLRIIAICMVVMIHSGIYISWSDNVKRYLSQGQMGLWIFMVLSGYLITASFEKDNCNIKKYFQKRFLRIVPLYWSYLIILMVIGKITGWFEYSVWDWFRNFIFCDLIIPSRNFSGMWGLGSLSSFFFFYLIGPVLIRWIDKVDRGIIMLIVGILLRIFSPYAIRSILIRFSLIENQDSIYTFAENTPLATIVFFVVGILIYRVEKSDNDKKIQLLAVLIMIWMSAIVIATDSIRVVGFSGMLVATVVLLPVELPQWVSRFNKIVSPYTFPVYICHFSVLDFTHILSGRETNTPLILLGPIVVAVIIHWCIEVPLTTVIKKKWMQG